MWWATAGVPEQVRQFIFHEGDLRRLHKLDIHLRELERVIYIGKRSATKENVTGKRFQDGGG